MDNPRKQNMHLYTGYLSSKPNWHYKKNSHKKPVSPTKAKISIFSHISTCDHFKHDHVKSNILKMIQKFSKSINCQFAVSRYNEFTCPATGCSSYETSVCFSLLTATTEHVRWKNSRSLTVSLSAVWSTWAQEYESVFSSDSPHFLYPRSKTSETNVCIGSVKVKVP